MDAEHAGDEKARTSVPGLDDILAGGLSAGHVFLLEGSLGTGKTTIALSLIDSDQQQSLLYLSDLELGETTKLNCCG